MEERSWLAGDVLITDPPYGIGYKSGNQYNTSEQRVNMERRGRVRTVVNDHDTSARDSVLNCWGTRPVIMFGTWRVQRPPNVKHRLIWHKKGRSPGMANGPWYPNDEEIYVIGDGWIGNPTPTVFTSHEARQGSYGAAALTGHPTSKPVPLMEHLIEKAPAGVIVDPFAGSGSTLLAARNLNRKAIGVEIEEQYCEVTARRLDQAVLDFGTVAL